MLNRSLKYKEEISAYVDAHRQELLDVLFELIAVPSVKSEPLPGKPFGENCAKALDKGCEIAQRYGFSTTCHDYYAASAVSGSGDKELGFIAHLDVVPVSIDGWASDPFTGIERDGFAVGRGSRDNKAGYAAALIAINCIRDLKIPVRSALRIIMGSDEESGMSDMEYMVENCKMPDFSIVTDCYFPAAYGEKGRVCGDIMMELNTDILSFNGGEAPNIIPDKCTAKVKLSEEKLAVLKEMAKKAEGIDIDEGEDGWTFTARGISAHASEPFKAVNAIWKLASFFADAKVFSGREQAALEYIKKAFSYYYGEGFSVFFEDEASGKLTLITGMVGTEKDCLRVNLDCRFPVTDKKDRVVSGIKGSVEKAGYRFENYSASDSHYIPKESPAVVKLTDAFNCVSGESLEAYVLAGGTYASKVPNSVAFGPGNQKEPDMMPYGPGHGDAHQPDESQNIDCLMDAVKIYAMGIIELDDVLHGEA